jgi:hypothetical protein
MKRHYPELVLSHRIVGVRLREADRLPHDHEELERDGLSRAHFPERCPAQTGEAVVDREIEERERQLVAPERLDHRLDRDPARSRPW